MILLICVICASIWLLLRDAMDRSHAPDQRFAINRDHSAIGKDLLQGLDSADVIHVTEHGG